MIMSQHVAATFPWQGGLQVPPGNQPVASWKIIELNGGLIDHAMFDHWRVCHGMSIFTIMLVESG